MTPARRLKWRRTFSSPTTKALFVINPAAYTHTSIAILDALKAVSIPAVEVHISDVSKRESFRQISYAGMACVKSYIGLGFEGYRQAILYLKDYLINKTGE